MVWIFGGPTASRPAASPAIRGRWACWYYAGPQRYDAGSLLLILRACSAEMQMGLLLLCGRTVLLCRWVCCYADGPGASIRACSVAVEQACSVAIMACMGSAGAGLQWCSGVGCRLLSWRYPSGPSLFTSLDLPWDIQGPAVALRPDDRLQWHGGYSFCEGSICVHLDPATNPDQGNQVEHLWVVSCVATMTHTVAFARVSGRSSTRTFFP